MAEIPRFRVSSRARPQIAASAAEDGKGDEICLADGRSRL